MTKILSINEVSIQTVITLTRNSDEVVLEENGDHKDPFDRLLISQAIVENMTLISADAEFSQYQVNLVW